jgi:ubiquinone/menaquinone biosynthesis C-methylase UbiE
MYTRSAQYYDRVMNFYNYNPPYERILAMIRENLPEAQSFLECACGTGLYLELFAKDFETTGIDISEEMLEICRVRCPRSHLEKADMVAFDLGRQYDVVACLFRGIGFVLTVDRMRSALSCMARHLPKGGLLLIEPNFTPEQHWDNRITLDTVQDNYGKIARMYVTKARGNIQDYDVHYLIGTSENVEHFTERYVSGLFTSEEYESGLRDAGVEILSRPPLPGTGVYLCRKL